MKGHFYRRGLYLQEEKLLVWFQGAIMIDIGIDPVTGKRKQKTKSGFPTKKEAEVVVAALIHELEQGIYIEGSCQTFSDFAKEWLPIYSDSKDVKPGTIRVRLHEIGKSLPYFGQLKLKDITLKRYQECFNDLKERGYSDSTREGIHRTGRMIFRKALEFELIKKEPTEFAYLKKNTKTIEQLEEEELPKYLEKEELALFLKRAKEHGLVLDYLASLILSYSGIRAGELIALKWKDIDFANHTISITKTCYKPSNIALKYQLGTPKTRKSPRKIILDEDVIDALKDHIKVQDEVIERLGDAYCNQDFIFAKMQRQYGYPIVIKQVRDRMKRQLAITGLNEDLPPHSLRHIHTSLLAEALVFLSK